MNAWIRRLYSALPVIRELRQLRQQLFEIRHALSVSNNVLISRYFAEELSHSPKYRDTRKLNHFESQVYSQNGEDGILAEIFRRIGCKDHFFVEVGVGNGLENNTVFLLMRGWRGCWIEGSESCGKEIRVQFADALRAGRLKFSSKFISAENIHSSFQDLGIPTEFDLLSLDIDRNTYHIWKALKAFQPRVIVVEYNATFPPDVEWTVEYDASRVWNQTCYFGASLKAFEQLGNELGYVLVGCDLSGTNAFFVRKNEPLQLFAEPFTAEHHYEPPRYWSLRRSAHPRGFSDSQQSETQV
jgi:hypothetical protein